MLNYSVAELRLYDKFGKLVDTNASKPGTQEIREIINELME